jgi:peptidoglycan/LPS O-acetylase OafA/YrhL
MATVISRPARQVVDVVDLVDDVRTAEPPRPDSARLARPVVPMGNQPALDGIRALSVAIVIAYHAGLGWMRGGFFGVEVFFVVSGFLITTLLLDERAARGSVSLRGFWARRARRLFPALFVVLLAVSLWAVLVQTEFAADLRRTLLPSVLYVSNWAEIFGDVPYFAPATPPLRHLWSLAVEEQWYLLWPIGFVLLLRVAPRRAGARAAVLGALAVAAMAWSAWLVRTGADPLLRVGGRDVDRFNFTYLNTMGRASGLLLGAAAAMVWRPWESRVCARREHRRIGLLDLAGLAAVVAIVAIAATRSATILTDAALYRVWMPLVTALSLVAVMVAVHPRAGLARRLFGWGPLVAVGRRSYGLYLWHWPVFAFAGVAGRPERLAPALLLTIGLSELCFRLVEQPVRAGSLARWWAQLAARGRAASIGWGLAVGLTLTLVVAGVAMQLRQAGDVDPAVGDQKVTFDVEAALAAAGSPVESSMAAPQASSPTPSMGASAVAPPAPETTTPVVVEPTAPRLPRRMVVLGDSQAHSLAINLPDGVEQVFAVSDGSIDGCSVQSTGRIVTSRPDFSKLFQRCAGWEQRWADAARAADAELALVVIGAWDVFDHEVDGKRIPFASPEADARFMSGVQQAIDVLGAEGVHVALLEVPCMRPIDVEGAGVPALPERGEDWRVAHLNELLRKVAAGDPAAATFVPGPTQWCHDPSVGASTAYRWDGVHVYQAGAALILETITAPLLAIPL